MKTFVWLCIVFMGGMVTALNLSLLIGHNPSYDASWLNVVVGILLALYGASMSQRINNED